MEQLIIAAAPVVDARTHLVSDDAQHWNTPNTIPPLVMRSKKLTLVQAFQQAAPNSDRLSPAPSRVMPCEADGAIFGMAGVTTQHKQDATDLFDTQRRTLSQIFNSSLLLHERSNGLTRSSLRAEALRGRAWSARTWQK